MATVALRPLSCQHSACARRHALQDGVPRRLLKSILLVQVSCATPFSSQCHYGQKSAARHANALQLVAESNAAVSHSLTSLQMLTWSHGSSRGTMRTTTQSSAHLAMTRFVGLVPIALLLLGSAARREPGTSLAKVSTNQTQLGKVAEGQAMAALKLRR